MKMMFDSFLALTEFRMSKCDVICFVLYLTGVKRRDLSLPYYYKTPKTVAFSPVGLHSCSDSLELR